MWSPQRYKSEAQIHGLGSETIDNAIDQIERVVWGPHELPSILTLNHLAERAEVSYAVLRSVVGRTADAAYRRFSVRKRSGGRRWISVPEPQLMLVQRWIAAHVLRNIPVHSASFAFAPGCSILKCAARHVGARWLIKMDVANFFGSISEIQVFRTFKELGYEPFISFELARICTWLPPRFPKREQPSWQTWRTYSISTYSQDYMGCLPQGAPTSPMLSNLVMRKIDAEIAEFAAEQRLTYTRYSDDITLSTRGDFDRSRATQLIQKLSKTLKSSGLFPNRSKTVVVPPGARKVVLGLTVNGDKPRLSREFKSRLRQHLYFLEKFGVFEHAKTRSFDTLGGMYRHILGLIDYARSVEPAYGEELLGRFQQLGWPEQGRG